MAVSSVTPANSGRFSVTASLAHMVSVGGLAFVTAREKNRLNKRSASSPATSSSNTSQKYHRDLGKTANQRKPNAAASATASVPRLMSGPGSVRTPPDSGCRRSNVAPAQTTTATTRNPQTQRNCASGNPMALSRLIITSSGSNPVRSAAAPSGRETMRVQYGSNEAAEIAATTKTFNAARPFFCRAQTAQAPKQIAATRTAF